MHSANHWGGSFEIYANDDDEKTTKNKDMDRAALLRELDDIQQSWLLGPQDKANKKKYIDFGCIVCSHDALRWTLASIFIAFLVIGLPIIISKSINHKKEHVQPPDKYTEALQTALLFFNAQKCNFHLFAMLFLLSVTVFIYLRTYWLKPAV